MKLRFESIKNRLKSYTCEIIKKIQITHKLDYKRYPIYLHDNIRLASCKKEPDTINWIETFDKDDVAFDIGANIGAYSLIMAKFCRLVYAFEPSAFTYATLIKNIYTNKAYNIIPLNIALSERKELLEFLYTSVKSGSSGHGISDTMGKQAYKQKVLSYSIDELVKDFNLEPPLHIKLDVDGAEFEILKGATQTLSNEAFKSLMVEADEKNKELFSYLGRLNLKLKARYYIGDVRLNNYLFLKE
jgi:FkbM family methyltransferase